MAATLLILAALAASAVAQLPATPTCQDPVFRGYAYCNPDLAPDVRAADLVSRMTLDEKVTQMNTFAIAIRRLAVPSYQWWSEGLHGVMFLNMTSFPQILGLSGTYDEQLWLDQAILVSTEGRALHNKVERTLIFAAGGLTFFSPDINIFRWGRGQEVPGEDPYLTGRYALAFISGLQGHPSDPYYDPNYVKLVATAKHFAAYSVEDGTSEGVPYNRHSFNAIVTEQDLQETYLPAFETSVREAKVRSLMCSYNRINGVPACANSYLMQELARDTWGFDGYVVSDCGAVNNIVRQHNYTQTIDETCALAITAGCELSCILFYETCASAVTNGLMPESTINRAVERLFEQRFALGMFDPPERVAYRQIPESVINTPETIAFARRAAARTMVLLKNEGDILPLPRNLRLAVIGPMANVTIPLLGNYAGRPRKIVSLLEGITNAVQAPGNVTFAQGCDVIANDTSGFDEARAVMAGADVVVLIVGTDNQVEREGIDRASVALPGVQEQLAQLAVASGKPVVAILVNGGPLDVTYLKNNADAILEAWYPGEQGGNGVADVVFGTYSPSALLTVTMYPAEYTSQIPITNMNMRDGPGRTYRFYTGEPVYPFGYGLSYTTFSYTAAVLASTNDIALTTALRAPLTFEVTVENTGRRDSHHVVLGMVSSPAPNAPLKSLFAFKSIFLRTGERSTVALTLNVKELATVDVRGRRFIAGGTYRISFSLGKAELSVTLSGEDSYL